VPSDAASPDDVRVLNANSFTPERIERLAWPWFYDLAPQRTNPLKANDLVESALTDNWLAYFPLLPMRWQGHAGFLGLDNLLNVAFNNLASSKSHLLAELVTHRDKAFNQPDGPDRIKSLRQELNLLLEQQVAHAFAEDGWKVKAASMHAGEEGKEEIDVLAFHEAGEVDLVLVTETKDFDFRLGSVNGTYLRKRVAAAQDQALRKAEFVRRNPRVLQRAFPTLKMNTHRVAAVPLVVTREGLPLSMFDRVYAVAASDVPGLLKLLRDSPKLALDMLGRQSST
jgi:hypothetical protein